MDPQDVEYEPVSVKEVLAEMKDTAELLIDLSYSAVLNGSDDIAREVLELEGRMDILQLQGRMSLLMSARSPEDAEQLAPVLGVIGAAEKISNAAGDIAKVVLEDIGMPDAIRASLPEAVEALVRATVAEESPYVGRTLLDINMETETGVRVIAIRRESATGKRRWLTNPGPDSQLQAGDSLLLRGPHDGVATVYETATGTPYEPPAVAEPPIEDLERAVDSITLMKDMSELAVDLAYGAMLFDSEGVAEEVKELEAEVDALKSRFEAWTLRAASRVEDPVQLRGLVHLASATEVISDAALEISEGVYRGIDAHPVVAAAIEESDEVIVRLSVAPDAPLSGTTLGEEMVKTETGMRVIAVRRGGDGADNGGEWVVQPGPTTELRGGDVIIAKGTRAGAERLSELVGDAREFEG
ncbi:potassium channel family protein [Halobellus rubicundus]|uniref:Potassium channel family protein n=1 Tax=Halobellus rubicundus TaxID=2996466 RepID=A0ABD5MFV9_9EURY